MKRIAWVVLAVVALAGCKGREEENLLRSEIARTQGEITALQPQVKDLEEARHDLLEIGEDFEDVGSLDGPNVWPAIAPRVIDAIFRADSERSGVTLAVDPAPPRNGKLDWTVKATPPAKVWEAAAAIVGDPSTEATALINVVEANGKVVGFFPLTPPDDTSKLLPLPKERPAPVPSPRTATGKKLADDLKGLEQKRARLEADAEQLKLLKSDLAVLNNRMSILVRVGNENARQRIFVATAEKLKATALKIEPDAVKASLHFPTAIDALKASKSTVLTDAHLQAAIDVNKLDVTFVGEPPKIKPYADRRKAIATDQVQRFQNQKKPEAKPKAAAR